MRRSGNTNVAFIAACSILATVFTTNALETEPYTKCFRRIGRLCVWYETLKHANQKARILADIEYFFVIYLR